MNRKAHPAGGKIFHVFALTAGDGIDVDERRAGDSGFGGRKSSRLRDEQLAGFHIVCHLPGVLHQQQALTVPLFEPPVERLVAAADDDEPDVGEDSYCFCKMEMTRISPPAPMLPPTTSR